MSETSIDWPEDLKLLLFPGDVHIDALFSMSLISSLLGQILNRLSKRASQRITRF